MLVILCRLLWANAFDDFLANMQSTHQQWAVLPVPIATNLTARYDTASCVLGDTLYLFGGMLADADETVAGDFWALDFTTLTWREILPASGATFPSARKKHHLLCDESEQKVYMVGGKKLTDCWSYLPATNLWQEIASAADPYGWSPEVQGTDAFPMNTDTHIIVAGTVDGVNNDWKAYTKATDSWALYQDERVGVEDPGGIGIGSWAIMVGGSIPKGAQLPEKTYYVDTAATPLVWQELVSDGFPGEEHRVVHMGQNLIGLLGDPSGKGPLSETNGIALLNLTLLRDNTTTSWTVVKQPPAWMEMTSEMIAVGYRGTLITLGGSVSHDDGTASATPKMWVYNAQVCPHGCSGRGDCYLGNCRFCEKSSGLGCEVEDPVPTDYTLLIVLTTTCGSAFLAIVGALVWRLTSKMREYRRMYNTSRLAEDMASQIACMQLGELAYLQDIANPTSVQRSFQKIVNILECYRPYLPESLFDNDPDMEPTFGAQAPGTQGIEVNTASEGISVGGGRACEVAIVFTDILKSTQIWETSPEGMRKGLQVHNRVIRECIAECSGYEVKTIGDSFMVAFCDVKSACQFGVRCQEELHRADWPRSLSEIPPCADAPGWHGLRIRAGIHYGAATAELNKLTMRTDYFGNTVNVASRMESCCIAGCVAITDGVKTELNAFGGIEAIGGPVELQMHNVSLKGVSGTSTVHLLLAASLSARLGDVQHMMTGGGLSVSVNVLEKQRSAESSRHGGSVVGGTPQNKNVRRLNERLDKVASATVACVSIGFAKLELEKWASPIIPVSNTLSDLLLLLERTQGSLVTFLNNSLFVGWNVNGGGSASHMLHATRFANLVRPSFANSASDVVGTVGICSGGLLSGRAGGAKQKFVTVMGGCVEGSMVFAKRAVEFKTTTLLAATVGQVEPSTIADLEGLIRPVDRYSDEESGIHNITVYELREGTNTRREEDDALEDWGWSRGYFEAFDTRNADLLVNAVPNATLAVVAEKLGTMERTALSPAL